MTRRASPPGMGRRSTAIRTANGEIFDADALTAAHRTLPMPVNVRVTNLDNGKSLVVRVNDRGPFAKGRIIDVSERAAKLLGFYGSRHGASARHLSWRAPILPNGRPQPFDENAAGGRERRSGRADRGRCGRAPLAALPALRSSRRSQ